MSKKTKTAEVTKTEQVTTETEELRKRPKINYVPLEMPTIYVNHAQLGFSMFDASITLGETIRGDVETNTMNVHPRAKLVMSHKFLVEFANLINRNLEQFAQDEELQELSGSQIENIAGKD